MQEFSLSLFLYIVQVLPLHSLGWTSCQLRHSWGLITSTSRSQKLPNMGTCSLCLLKGKSALQSFKVKLKVLRREKDYTAGDVILGGATAVDTEKKILIRDGCAKNMLIKSNREKTITSGWCCVLIVNFQQRRGHTSHHLHVYCNGSESNGWLDQLMIYRTQK